MFNKMVRWLFYVKIIVNETLDCIYMFVIKTVLL
jgi:hypothetical protein